MPWTEKPGFKGRTIKQDQSKHNELYDIVRSPLKNINPQTD
jgi:hypothetical protein